MSQFHKQKLPVYKPPFIPQTDFLTKCKVMPFPPYAKRGRGRLQEVVK